MPLLLGFLLLTSVIVTFLNWISRILVGSSRSWKNGTLPSRSTISLRFRQATAIKAVNWQSNKILPAPKHNFWSPGEEDITSVRIEEGSGVIFVPCNCSPSTKQDVCCSPNHFIASPTETSAETLMCRSGKAKLRTEFQNLQTLQGKNVQGKFGEGFHGILDFPYIIYYLLYLKSKTFSTTVG